MVEEVFNSFRKVMELFQLSLGCDAIVVYICNYSKGDVLEATFQIRKGNYHSNVIII